MEIRTGYVLWHLEYTCTWRIGSLVGTSPPKRLRVASLDPLAGPSEAKSLEDKVNSLDSTNMSELSDGYMAICTFGVCAGGTYVGKYRYLISGMQADCTAGSWDAFPPK